MKKLIIIAIVALMGTTVYSQNKNARALIEVDGVCMMCKERIEKASIKTKGVKSAVWDVKTHELSLIFDERKTNLETIQASVASVGHDTQDVIATEHAYNSVHACCKYRDEDVKDDHKN
ncbi:MAG: mercuric ion binding protein [Candidatus Latescibacterota bacterium]|jgi:mercuric ion binding protein